MPVKLLSPEACPLLDKIPEVRLRYNALAEDLLKIQREDSVFFARQDFQQVVADAEAAQELLSRTHYEVGFIGLFQVSKSTSFNRILRAPESDRPAMEGGTTNATTASVTRVQPIALDAPEHRMTLRYLTRQAYEAKVKALLKRLIQYDSGLDIPEDASEEQLRQALPELIRLAGDRKLSDLKLNLEYLFRTLSARASLDLGKLLLDGEEGLSVPKPYAQRCAYINHPGDPSIPLLRDIVLQYRTDVVPKEVEIIDMPGLGAGLDVDSVLTGELMSRLNGVMLFCEASRDFGGKLIGEVMRKLHKQFPDGLRGRVWVIFTKCDALSEPHFKEENNAFAGITGMLKKVGIEPDQVCFVCNFWDGKGPEEYERFLVDRAKTTDLAAKFPQYPELVKAFGELGRSGGIDRLRELITHTLGDEVRRETQREMAQRLDRLSDKLRAARELRAQEKRFDPERRKQLQVVLDAVKVLQAHLESRRDLLPENEPLRDYFREPALKLAEELKTSFDGLYPHKNWLAGESLATVAEEFDDHSWRLDEKLHNLLETQVLPAVYEGLGQQFAGVPSVPLASCPNGVAARWDEWATADGRDRLWREKRKMPTFQDKELFAPPKVPPLEALNGLGYRDLMLEKIRTASYQTGHSVRMQLRERLRLLEEGYREALKVQKELEKGSAPGTQNPA